MQGFRRAKRGVGGRVQSRNHLRNGHVNGPVAVQAQEDGTHRQRARAAPRGWRSVANAASLQSESRFEIVRSSARVGRRDADDSATDEGGHIIGSVRCHPSARKRSAGEQGAVADGQCPKWDWTKPNWPRDRREE